MTPTETAAILRKFSEWRRDDDYILPQPDPRKVGKAIDAAIEMIERLESAESDALEQARLNGMGASREAALMAKLEAAEKDIALKERIIDSLGSALNAVANERDALQAKVEEMEQQEPVATVIKKGADRYWMSERMGTLPDGTHTLYLAPGEHPAPSIPEGWKLVPIEPTPEMMRAAQKADHDHGNHEEWLEYDGEDVKRVYRAMLAAAPEAKPCL